MSGAAPSCRGRLKVGRILPLRMTDRRARDWSRYVIVPQSIAHDDADLQHPSLCSTENVTVLLDPSTFLYMHFPT